MKSYIEKFIEANKLALQYFVKCFSVSEKAQSYVACRISLETARKYKIGYAPRVGLIPWLEKHNVSIFCSNQLGLTRIRSTGEVNSVFQYRIMIPIIHAGLVVGFGGRTMLPDEPKYLNSRTSMLYQKKEVLFNLHLARHHIDRLGYALLVEGYFDVLGLADHGILNVVATCGTAFSHPQASLLKRYTDKVYTFFDGDRAGANAAVKTKLVLKSLGMYKGRIILPNGFDPDTYVKKYGKKSLKKLKVIY